MTFYRHILKRAWEITWKSRYLWFFGLFVALLGNGGEYEIVYRNLSNDGGVTFSQTLSDIASTGIFTGSGLKNALRTAIVDPVNFSIIIITLLVFLALVAFMVWLVMVCQGSLVSGAAKLIQNKKTTFKESLQTGMLKIWPVFSLNVLNALIISLLGWLVLMTQSSGLFYIILFVLFIPLAIVVSFVIKYSIGYTVIKGQNLIDSLLSGLNLFKNNWLISIEMALLLAIINVAMGLAAVMLILVISIPLMFFAFLFIKAGVIAGFWLVTILGTLFLLVLVCIVGAIIATFQTSAWTGLYLELINRGGTSKLARIFGSGA